MSERACPQCGGTMRERRRQAWVYWIVFIDVLIAAGLIFSIIFLPLIGWALAAVIGGAAFFLTHGHASTFICDECGHDTVHHR